MWLDNVVVGVTIFKSYGKYGLKMPKNNDSKQKTH